MATVNVQTEDDVAIEKIAPPAVPVAAVKQPRRVSKHFFIEGVLVVAVALLGIYAWGLSSDKTELNKQLASAQANPQAIVEQQTQQLITKVGKLIDLPANETPTIAAVTDVAAAKKQSSFFNNAENGDKVLLYVKAGKAILYRPSTNKIIESQPLTINNNTTTGTTTTAPTNTTKKQ